jgi:hypothetical protein
MAISFRIIFWIPVALFFLLNLFFKLIIWILQNFGNGIVWCNRQVIKAGDWATDKAQNDQSVDDFIKRTEVALSQTKARRGKK